jgi:hypothetical protein
MATFEVLEGKYAGRKITWYGSFSQTVMKNGKKVEDQTYEAMRAAGWTGSDITEIESLDNAVLLTIEEKEYEGTARPKIIFINPLSSGVRKIIGATPQQKAKMSAWSKSVASKYPIVTAPKEAQRFEPADHDQPPMGDDDIPF